MDGKDLFAALDIGIGYIDLTVEAARTQQRRIKHVLAVGGRDDDDALISVKAVHLDQQLVQRLLAFVVAATDADTTGAADGVDLVDKDDAGGGFLGLLEHVADAARTDA